MSENSYISLCDHFLDGFCLRFVLNTAIDFPHSNSVTAMEFTPYDPEGSDLPLSLVTTGLDGKFKVWTIENNENAAGRLLWILSLIVNLISLIFQLTATMIRQFRNTIGLVSELVSTRIDQPTAVVSVPTVEVFSQLDSAPH